MSELKTLEQVERDAIKDALQRHNGDKIKAAAELGISSRTIYRKLEKYKNAKT